MARDSLEDAKGTNFALGTSSFLKTNAALHGKKSMRKAMKMHKVLIQRSLITVTTYARRASKWLHKMVASRALSHCTGLTLWLNAWIVWLLLPFGCCYRLAVTVWLLLPFGCCYRLAAVTVWLLPFGCCYRLAVTVRLLLPFGCCYRLAAVTF